MATEASNKSSRRVLEGVPQLMFGEHDGKVELCPFPASLKSSLEYMGEHIEYQTVLGVSGAAFRLTWNPSCWDGGNIDLLHCADDPLEPHRRAFAVVGRAYEFVANDEYRSSSEVTPLFTHFAGRNQLLQRIIQSIDAGRPVLALGVIGPPECCIISGYDEGGDVLIGWNFFQTMPEFNPNGEFEPSGHFRKRDWYKETTGIFVIGDGVEKPSTAELDRNALEWALEMIRKPQVRQRRSGLAAYQAWADALLDDTGFATNKLEELAWRWMAHGDAMTMVAEGRWYASIFLADIARRTPKMAAPLYTAAACFATEHDLMWKIWGVLGGLEYSETIVRTLAKPESRRQIVSLILQARDQDQEAAKQIECALTKE